MNPQSLRRLLSILEQGFQALGNLVVTVLLARWLSVQDFAEVATALTIWFFFESLQRTGILMPYISDVPDPVADPERHSNWFVINLSFLVFGSLFLLLQPNVYNNTLTVAIKFSIFIIPAAGIYFYIRRSLYHQNRVFIAFWMSFINVFSMFIAIGLFYFQVFSINAEAAVCLYVGSFLFSGFFGFIFLYSTFQAPSGVFSYLNEKRSHIFEMSLGAVFAYFYNNGIQLVVSAFAVAAEAAAFSATRVIVRPLIVVVTAFSDVERSAASRAYYELGDDGLDCFLRKMFTSLVLLIFPVGLLLIYFAPDILSFLFSGKYDQFSSEARLWLVALVPQIIAIPLDIKNSVRKKSRFLLLARFSGASASVITLCVLALIVGNMQAWIGIFSVGFGRMASLVVLNLRQ